MKKALQIIPARYKYLLRIFLKKKKKEKEIEGETNKRKIEHYILKNSSKKYFL